jgi:flavin reductase (DIM6/NTAB) family NADH-FMN oxidoreductase RutF
MTRKKPWNRVNLPVYAISSTDGKGHFNVNIATYVTAVSMRPKRFICGIYEGTQTLAFVKQHPHFVLQLLAAEQYRLVDLLGKKTGRQVDKIARLQKRDLIMDWNGFKVTRQALALMELRVINGIKGGDHDCFLCELVAYKNTNDGTPLTLDVLRTKKMVRI